MGAQLQNLYNQGSMQQGNDYNTTLGNYFNQTTPTSPYWGSYTQPLNINPTNTTPAKQTTSTSSPMGTHGGGSGEVFYDANKGQYYTLGPRALGIDGGSGAKQYIGTSLNDSSNNSDSSNSGGGSFKNPSPLPNYSMYTPPEQMPDINAYLYSPNSLLGAMQNSGIPIAGAGRFANLLSTNTSKGK
jgi:hypothetical protein